MSIDEISSKLEGEKAVMRKLRFSHAISPIENPSRIKDQKKLIARLNTVLAAKQKAENGDEN